MQGARSSKHRRSAPPQIATDAETLIATARATAEAAGVPVSVTVLDAAAPEQDHAFATTTLKEIVR